MYVPRGASAEYIKEHLMRVRNWKTGLIPALFIGVPLMLACDPGDQGQGMMQEQPAQPGMETQPTAGVSDTEIETMAEVYVAMTELQEVTDARAAAAATPEEQNRIQAEGSNEMRGILEEHGMSVEEYQEMVQLLNERPAGP
jgi:hypothetical protein